MAATTLIDAGPLVAMFRRSEQFHDLVLAVAKRLHSPPVTCWPVLVEAAYLLRHRPEEVASLLRAVRGGIIVMAELGVSGLTGIEAIMAKYADLGVQLADTALLHIADRDDLREVFTLDHRHFSVMKSKRGVPLQLLPSLEELAQAVR